MTEGHKVELRGTNGAWFWFDTGALSFEFVNTGAEAWRLLRQPDDLARWASLSRLGAVAPIGDTDTAITAHEAVAAHDLQGLLQAAFDRSADGRRVVAEHAQAISSAARSARPVLQLTADGHSRWLTPISGTSILAEVAHDAILVFSNINTAPVRRCQGSGCHLVFVDNSRGHRRRWCSMERCGNRAKQREHRRRSSEPAP